MHQQRLAVDPRLFEAAVFDMDGVLTDTVSLHEMAWKEILDRALQALGRSGRGDPASTRPFDHEDYLAYVDGKPRLDGVRSFLDARGLALPDTAPDGALSVESIGTEKNERYLELLRGRGASTLPGVVPLLEDLKAAGMRVGVISASRNAAEVLDSAGLSDYFEARVDGLVAEELSLPGKPDPAVFLEAARRLDAGPQRTIVIEDAIAGVEAGRTGAFALVVGVAQGGGEEALLAHGADTTVTSLEEMRVLEPPPAGAPARPAQAAPDLATLWPALSRGLPPRRPLAVFLDYDGTLTPIVERPEDAVLHPEMRARLERLAEHSFVGVVSGRDVSFIQEQVGVSGVTYLGSHGFQIVDSDGNQHEPEVHREFERALPVLDSAQSSLEAAVADLEGVEIERKRYAVAVHYRRASPNIVPRLRDIVAAEAGDRAGLRVTGGKKIFEIRPDIDWDKGRAVVWVLEEFGLAQRDAIPVYVGDDVTDEDAFSRLDDGGITVVVTADPQRETTAHYRVDDVACVGELLEDLAAQATRHSGG